ncbi:MAG: PIN domain-containing protein [Candidatus Bathyarchaeota archaeon]|uniref:PIN domain-containing protein n=1 Tax=Candidatus Bathycorpusculum sp. TaxID=2994959 RepID=UPI0028355BCA|nr:PIN domain-containing protein [Candidatus Termiticorpusculum sp.]MCL2258065.1 PIN domain-containing protein [Candidatus Termiticorpusculum sp.]MCL2291695.1 PIN domain-containing protein [Candidatus Termiticorpusculum sp.]
MNTFYVMDACALIAFLRDEQGTEAVTAVLKYAKQGKAEICMNSINLLEVYYDIYRNLGKTKADEELFMIKELPIMIQSELTDRVFSEAGRFKASYRVSLADSIALAEASVSGGELLTADHHEFDVIEKQEEIKFHWIR